jgi:DNA phosphorothioation-dependent restriction protein DptH
MPEPAKALPKLVVDRIAAALTEHVAKHEAGHCVRVDNLRKTDAECLARVLQAGPASAKADVRVLTDRPDHADGDLSIPAERAVELRNRKQRQLVLLIPVGIGAAASSLDNSFERRDAVDLLSVASEALMDELPPDDGVQTGVRKVARELGSKRPVEAWARYVATVSAEPSWQTIGASLPLVGLIPDHGTDLVKRLADNSKCVKAISRPARAVSTVADRLSKAGLQAGAVRERLAGFLSDAHRDLSNPGSWTAALADADDLGFERWPLAEPKTVDVDQVRVAPFVRQDGKVVATSRLKQKGPNDLPFTEVGEGVAGSVRVTWTTDPAKTDAIHRWLVEVLPPADLRDDGDATEPIAKMIVASSRRTATVTIDIDEADLEQGSLFIVRVTGLDTAGQPVLLRSGDDIARDESQQFTVRWEDALISGDTRRASAWALALGRLDAVLGGQDDLSEDAYSEDDTHNAVSLRLGGRRTVLLGVSPVIADLQRRLFEQGSRATAFEAAGRMGEMLELHRVEPIDHVLPQALARARKEIHALFGAQPRSLVESVAWNDELRTQVRSYCQSYKRALDQAITDPAHRDALLSLDTLTLSVTTAGGQPIRAVVVLPFHPMRLAWLAEYDTAVTGWARELAKLEKAQRKKRVDADLIRRVTPANLPFAVPAGGDVFVHAREATVGTGIYLAPGEREPGIAVQAVFDVIGIDRRDVATDVPPNMLAERISTYRYTHSHPDAVRLLAINPGSGELLAKALGESVLTGKDTDSDVTRLTGRAEVVAYTNRQAGTDPLPALTDLQKRVGGYRVGNTRSYLRPPLGLSVRPFERLAADVEPAHLSVVNDLAVVAAAGAPMADATTAFRNLLTPTTSRPVTTEHGRRWETVPAVKLRDGKNKNAAADAVDAHRAHQAVLAVQRGFPAEHGIALRVSLGDDETTALTAAHDRADWVLSIDRNLGFELFTEHADRNRLYIVDYAPDFLEGIGPRLTVTTKHRGEIERLLSAAMRDMGFADAPRSVRDTLHCLHRASGRLALRLIGKTDLAAEAVGLAATLAWLDSRGELKDTIIVPVDVHREIFGAAADGPRLCDLILVTATRQSLRMTCVEVTSRQGDTPPEQLTDDIAERINATVSMLDAGFLGTDSPRTDADLQRTRLAGILRHHAHRAFAMGMLSEERLAVAERQFARLEDSVNVEISRHGYLVNLDGELDVASEYRGVPIEVLTAAKLRKAGVGTLLPNQPAQPPKDKAVSDRADTASGTEPALDSRPGSAGAPAVGTAPADSEAETSHAEDPKTGEQQTGGRPGEVRVVLGKDAHSAEVSWRISTSGSPHMFVLGIPGQGKSVTTRRILTSFAGQGLPALVIDFHGDMAANPAANAAVVDAADGLDFSPFELRAGADHRKYAQAALELAEVIGFVSGLGEIQRDVVYKTLRELYQQHGFGSTAGPSGLPTMAEFASLLEFKEATGPGKNVTARVRPLSDFDLFRDNPGDGRFGDLLSGGMVLDVHSLMEQVQLAAAAFVLRKVYREMFHWGQTDRLRLAVVLDEAHRLAKDVTLPKIMKEGRKYGIAVVVASQGVDDFHRDVLGNAGTKVAFRCNFPQSKTVAGFLRGRAGQDMAQALEKLGVGQAYVSTPDSPEAKKVFMEP